MSYGRDDLHRAWRNLREATPGSDVEEHYQRRVRGLAAALDVDPVPTRDLLGSAPPEMQALAQLGDSLLRELRTVRSPFDGYLEAPAEVIALHRRFGSELRDRADALRSGMEDLLDAILMVVWGIPDDRRVTRQQVLAHGFDLDEPVPVDPDEDMW